VDISVNKHGSGFIAIIGHHDCAGNPVEDVTHREQIRKAVGMIAKWYPELQIAGLFVDKDLNVQKL
jgi:carbonic anhydrase